jgi:transcriptional regulator GlxA family with amidase domain
MKTIAIPALQTEESMGAIGPFEILTKTCSLWRQLSDKNSGCPLFDVQIVSHNRRPIPYSSGITVKPHATLNESRPDIIVVPSLDEDIGESLKRNHTYVSWVRDAFGYGVHVSSFCTGAFILGAAGILNGRRATTHWFFAKEFKQRFPEVRLQEERVIVDEGNIVTCGAATSFLNLVIYLVEKYFGREVAILASKMFLIDMDRPSQRPFQIFSSRISHTDTAIARAQKFINERFRESIGLAALARHAGMSLRNFSRRFKVATGESAANYIQELRINEAKRLLETSDLSASEITYRVGYNDDRSFRRLFTRRAGLSPKHYRDKFKFPFQNTPSKL